LAARRNSNKKPMIRKARGIIKVKRLPTAPKLPVGVETNEPLNIIFSDK